MSPLLRRWVFLFAVIVIVLVVDQVSKSLVVANLDVGQSFQPIPALSSFFQITRSENTGAAFGFVPQAGDLFLIIALVVVVVMLAFYPRVPEKARASRLAMGMIIGGALGNALDRVTRGGVIDFIHYQLPGVISNVSNLADHAIVLGVLIIVVQSWRSDTAKAPEEEPSGNNPS